MPGHALNHSKLQSGWPQPFWVTMTRKLHLNTGLIKHVRCAKMSLSGLTKNSLLDRFADGKGSAAINNSWKKKNFLSSVTVGGAWFGKWLSISNYFHTLWKGVRVPGDKHFQDSTSACTPACFYRISFCSRVNVLPRTKRPECKIGKPKKPKNHIESTRCLSIRYITRQQYCWVRSGKYRNECCRCWSIHARQ